MTKKQLGNHNDIELLIEESLRLSFEVEKLLVDVCNKKEYSETEILLCLGKLSYIRRFVYESEKRLYSEELPKEHSEKLRRIFHYVEKQRYAIEQDLLERIDENQVTDCFFLSNITSGWIFGNK